MKWKCDIGSRKEKDLYLREKKKYLDNQFELMMDLPKPRPLSEVMDKWEKKELSKR